MTFKLRILALCLLLALIPILDGCAGSASQSGKRLSNADLTIVSFGSVHGEVAPCG